MADHRGGQVVVARVARGAAIALMLCLALAQNASATTTKNYSILFLHDNFAVTGTLKAGQFVQKHTITFNKHWDLAAASRTSLLLYNYTTGAAQAGTFLNGTYVKLHTYTLPTGYLDITASCDSLLMYRPSDGKAITATLVNGVLGTRHKSTISNIYDYDKAAASCDTYMLVMHDPLESAITYGKLKAGSQTAMGDRVTSELDDSLVAMTDSSYLVYSEDGPGFSAQTGTAKNGQTISTSTVPGFSEFDTVAGTADTVLFYNSATGLEARATLVNGQYGYVGGGSDFSSGWSVIVGAK